MRIADAREYAGLPPLETEMLLGAVLRKPRTWLLAHPETALTLWRQWRLRSLIRRRRRHEPMAQILGEKEFYGRIFLIDRHVLVPRPSTEGLIDHCKEFLQNGVAKTAVVDSGICCVCLPKGDTKEAKLIVDIGTGSGCIAVTLACELPEYRFIATDIHRHALRVAKKNAEKHHVGDLIELRRGSLLQPIQDLQTPFVLVANPPYIPDGEILMEDVALFEPGEALFAGEKGLDVLMPLVREAMKHPFCRGVVVECREEQIDKLINR